MRQFIEFARSGRPAREFMELPLGPAPPEPQRLAEDRLNLLHSPRAFGFISRHLLCSVPLAARRVALTFDDGPNPVATPRLLSLLAASGIRATFFLLGRNVRRFPHLAAQIAADGHEIGNHTHNHFALPLLPRPLALRELERTSRLIESTTGQRPHLVRPPLGWFSSGVLRTLAANGYRAVLGDVYPRDCTRPGADVIARRVLERARPGSIVILHDGVPYGRADRMQTVDAVALVIDELHRQQYSFGTVSHLLDQARAESV